MWRCEGGMCLCRGISYSFPHIVVHVVFVIVLPIVFLIFLFLFLVFSLFFSLLLSLIPWYFWLLLLLLFMRYFSYTVALIVCSCFIYCYRGVLVSWKMRVDLMWKCWGKNEKSQYEFQIEDFGKRAFFGESNSFPNPSFT